MRNGEQVDGKIYCKGSCSWQAASYQSSTFIRLRPFFSSASVWLLIVSKNTVVNRKCIPLLHRWLAGFSGSLTFGFSSLVN